MAVKGKKCLDLGWNARRIYTSSSSGEFAMHLRGFFEGYDACMMDRITTSLFTGQWDSTFDAPLSLGLSKVTHLKPKNKLLEIEIICFGTAHSIISKIDHRNCRHELQT